MFRAKDVIFIIVLGILFLPFFLSKELYHWFEQTTVHHPFITSFVKFAIVATVGESLGLRITKGVYNEKGFGLIPRALVWGLLGVLIQIAFIIFAKGTPFVLESLFQNTIWQNNTPKIVTALATSTFLNIIFAPVMMTLHKITDIHIVANEGKLASLLKPIHFAKILKTIDWHVQWNFLFKKTIPLFWIPAHTLTFLLPPQYRVLFAAVLGIILGVILSIARLKKH